MDVDGGFEVVAADLGYCEGPVWLADGTVACTSITGAAVHRVAPDGTVSSVRTGGGANGLAVDADGTLYVAQNGGIWGGEAGAEPGVQRIRGEEVAYVVDGMGAPNDVCFGPDGRLWFTDPRQETDPHHPETSPPGRLWTCRPDGSDLHLAHEGLAFINGLAFDASGTTLYLIETARQRVLAASWTDGTIGEPTPVAVLEVGFPDGMAVDVDGNLWVAGTFADGILVFSPAGELLDRHPTGEGSQPTNCCFGGPDLSTLYVVASAHGRLLRKDSGTKGLPLYPFR